MESLHTCLASLSPHVRGSIAKEHSWDGNSDDLASLAETIINAATELAMTHHMEATLLRRVIFLGGDRFIGVEDEHVKEDLSPLHARMGWIALRRKGFVYTFRRSWGESGIWCPKEIRDACLMVWLPTPPRGIEGVSVEGTDPVSGVWNDAFHLLCMLDRENFPLTVKGKIPQHFLRKLMAELDLEDEGLEESPWNKEDISPRLSLLFSFAKQEGWIEKTEEQIVLNETSANKWLQLSWEKRLQGMFSFVRQQFLQVHPEWDSLWRWMERQGEGPTLLRSTWLEWKAIANSSSTLEEWEVKWLRPLEAIGWVEMGEVDEGIWWKWSSWAPPICEQLPQLPTYVKPDFEVLIPVFTPGSERRLLAQFADYMGGEQFFVHYEITVSSVRRGMEKGLLVADMEKVLTTLSTFPLPENVLHSLILWGEQHARVRIGHEILLQVSDSVLADELLIDPILSSLLGDRIGPTHFLLDTNDLPAVRERLEARGTPSLEITKGDKEFIEDKPLLEIHNDQRIEDRIPEWEEAVPGITQIPRLWTSAPRGYHSTTLRKLLEKSIQMGLTVKWLDKEDRAHQFVIHRLFRKEGIWRVEGQETAEREKVSVSLEEMEQVQIILPWEESITP
ncbi:Helicase conserved C-terminal domain-containing protein [Marininema mesophilum]|uniref:Helicase conserved C-terminal domain-containing protein n=1 Tax=Marininema mesophilum TaxID=1048340 RepID=A0A1H2VK19_9BACL|nr:helicase-associated domain-containing protein [Marininema mesophilum]SDW68580.1 Helicase conserved C-terminal domain-containing protein [Marininema mesophilum]